MEYKRKEIATTAFLVLIACGPHLRGQATSAPTGPTHAEGTGATLDLALLRKAEQSERDGRLEEARAQFEKLTATGAADRRTWRELARVQMALGDATGAVTALVSASRFRKRDYDVTLALAEALRIQSRQAAGNGDDEAASLALADALRYFRNAAAQRPTSPAPLLGQSRVERQQGHKDEALRLAVRATEADPKDMESLLELGSQRYVRFWNIQGTRGREAARDALELCRQVYARALDLDPGEARALNGLGWLAVQKDQPRQAISYFRKSLLADPTLDDSYENLVRLLGRTRADKQEYLRLLGDVVGAARRFPQVAARRHAESVALYRRGLANAALFNVPAMEKDFTAAARLDHGLSAACRLQLALGLYRDNQYERAGRVVITQVAADLPALLDRMALLPQPRDGALMIRALADKRFRKDDLESARELFRVTAEALGDSLPDWNNYAFCCRETRHYEESYRAYQRALEIDDSDPSLLNDTALVLQYHLRRDLPYARELYNDAIAAGQRVLADVSADSDAKKAAQTAIRDATANLRKLDAGKPGARPARRKRGH